MKLFGRILVTLIILYISNGEKTSETEDVELFTSPLERIPVHHALKSLEEAVKEIMAIEDFCQKHYGNVTYGTIQKKNDNEHSGFAVKKPSDCADLFKAGNRTSGVYKIYLKSSWIVEKEINVYCDMETHGGGWTVFQRRGDFPSRVNFTRSWEEYANGFGNLHEEFWLGNENIHKLSAEKNVTLRVVLEDWKGNSRHANYDSFEVGPAKHFYKLLLGKYEGDAGDSLTYHNDSDFATYDHDTKTECSKTYRGGWWYKICHHSNLNGENLKGVNDRDSVGITWKYWLGQRYSLKWTEMKMRPSSFN
uniref:Ryncolin n=1 Tax=Hemiscolopendra marginata TaxID=943146 RepID=A0A646QI93_9MYRI